MTMIPKWCENCGHNPHPGLTCLNMEDSDCKCDLRAAGGVSPTAPDEREALAETYRASTGWEMSEGNAVVDAYLAGYDAGFRRSREATTEPRPIDGMSLEELIEDRLHDAGLVWWSDGPGGSGQIVEGLKEDVIRAVLEAVEASRSPKPTERSKP